MRLRMSNMRALPGLLALGAVLLVLVPAGQATTTASSAAQRMNIVFILTDDQSIDSIPKMPFVGQYGNWIEFDHAYINDPMCCPSRATIATGLYSHHTHVENNQDKGKFDDKLHLRDLATRERLPHWFLREVPPRDARPEGAQLHPARLGRLGVVPRRLVLQLHAERKRKARPLRLDPEGLLDGRARREGAQLHQRRRRHDSFFAISRPAPRTTGTRPAPRYEGRFKTEPIPHTPSLQRTRHVRQAELVAPPRAAQDSRTSTMRAASSTRASSLSTTRSRRCSRHCSRKGRWTRQSSSS